MLPGILGLAVIGALTIHVEDVRGVSASDEQAILDALSNALRARSRQTPGIDPIRGACEPRATCVNDVTTRTGAKSVVLIRVLGVPSRIRLVAASVRPGASSGVEEKSEVDLALDRQNWQATFETMAKDLIPEWRPMVIRPILEEQPAPTIIKTTNWGPLALMGGSVVAASVGVGFGMSSRGARSDARDPALDESTFNALDSRAVGHGLAANVLFATAAAGAVAGVIWLLVD